MKLTPIRSEITYYSEDDHTQDIFECCDSVVAVLADDQIEPWFAIYNQLATGLDAHQYCDYASTTQVFQIDGNNFVVVADSGGELTVGEFELFCQENDVPYQAIVDSIDCQDMENMDDFYTGQCDDNSQLLALVHRLYN